MPSPQDFQLALGQIIMAASMNQADFVDVRAGELHRRVGGYPGPNQDIELCCSVMRELMNPGDYVVREPANGIGPLLAIRYRLPR